MAAAASSTTPAGAFTASAQPTGSLPLPDGWVIYQEEPEPSAEVPQQQDVRSGTSAGASRPDIFSDED